jgi:hypothetical protein
MCATNSALSGFGDNLRDCFFSVVFVTRLSIIGYDNVL